MTKFPKPIKLPPLRGESLLLLADWALEQCERDPDAAGVIVTDSTIMDHDVIQRALRDGPPGVYPFEYKSAVEHALSNLHGIVGFRSRARKIEERRLARGGQ